MNYGSMEKRSDPQASSLKRNLSQDSRELTDTRCLRVFSLKAIGTKSIFETLVFPARAGSWEMPLQFKVISWNVFFPVTGNSLDQKKLSDLEDRFHKNQ